MTTLWQRLLAVRVRRIPDNVPGYGIEIVTKPNVTIKDCTIDDGTRPVWLTRGQLEDVTFGVPKALDALCDAWDAAPADPTQAVHAAILHCKSGTVIPSPQLAGLTADVLRALGKPEVLS